MFPEFVSCRDCEVNGFEMKWVYELVARSQEARLSDRFVHSDSLIVRLILKGMCPLSCFLFLFRFNFFLFCMWRGMQKFGTGPHFLFSTRLDLVERNDHITSPLSGVFHKLKVGGA